MGSFAGLSVRGNRLSLWRFSAPLWAILLHLAASTAVGQAPYRRIAKTGNPVPGMPDVVFGGIGSPAIDASGRIALRVGLDGPGITGANNDAVFHGSPGNLNLVVRERDLLPEFGAGVYSRLYSQPFVAQSGEMGFRAILAGGNYGSFGDLVLLAGTPDALHLVAQGHTTPPDVNDGSVYGNLDFSVSMGRGGYVAYKNGLGAPGFTDPPEQSGLWAGTPDDPRLVARTGEQAPGTEAGVHFSLSYLTASFTVNRRGAVAFPAPIDGPGVNATNGAGIWVGTHDDLGLVVRTGDPARLPEADATFAGFPSSALINGNDRVMFPAFISGNGIDASNDFGLWAGNTSGVPTLIAREGDEVPLLGPDYSIANIFPYVQTEDDRVAMVTTVNGPGVTPDNDQAIFFGGPGNWDLLFREGDQAPGLPDGVVLNFDVLTPHIAIIETGAAGLLVGLDGVGVTEPDNEALFWRRSDTEPWQLIAREGAMFDGSIIADGGISLQATGGGEGARPNINERGDLAFWIQFEGEFPNEVFGAYVVPVGGLHLLFLVNVFVLTFGRKRASVAR